jgi:hypothetical protein
MRNNGANKNQCEKPTNENEKTQQTTNETKYKNDTEDKEKHTRAMDCSFQADRRHGWH